MMKETEIMILIVLIVLMFVWLFLTPTCDLPAQYISANDLKECINK
jgi:hypothetical protein